MPLRDARTYFSSSRNPCARAVWVDALLLGFGAAEFAEAGYVAGVDGRRVVRGSEAVAEGALTLGSPHDAVDVVGAGVVLDEAGEEIAVVGIVDAERFGIAAVEIFLLNFFDVGEVGAEDILEPADDFHAALVGGGDDFGEDVEVAVVGGAQVLEDCVFVELGMGRGEVSAVEVEIVLLLAVVGERLAGDLASGDAAAVGEDGQEECVYSGAFLEDVQDFLGAFVYEGDGSYLDTDGFGGGGGLGEGWHGQSCGGSGG